MGRQSTRRLNEVFCHGGNALGRQLCAVAARLSRLHQLVVSTGQLRRLVVFGSFVATTVNRNDVGIVLLMDDSFDLAAVTGESALVFQHIAADA
jgi:hypothetical protein